MELDDVEVGKRRFSLEGYEGVGVVVEQQRLIGEEVKMGSTMI